MENKIQHIAIIPDGNRRWAKNRNFPPSIGHYSGGENAVNFISWIQNLNIRYVSFFIFSSENKKRTDSEKKYLNEVFKKICEKDVKKLYDSECKIKFLGHKPDFYDDSLTKMIEEVEDTSKNYDKTHIFLYSGYGGKTEIIDAIKSCIGKCVAGDLSADDITEDYFGKNLYAGDVPPPDILIRTSGEQRLSNFLLWQLAYSELFFCEKYWPDFSKDDLNCIVNEFLKRERRYGE